MALARSILSGQNGQCPLKAEFVRPYRTDEVFPGDSPIRQKTTTPVRQMWYSKGEPIIGIYRRLPEPVGKYRGEMNVSVSNLIGVIIGLIERFFSEGIREDHDLEDRLRIRVINIISVITILVLTFFGTVALGKGQLTLGLSDLSVALIFFITQIYLRTTGNYSFVKYFWVGSTGALFVYLFITTANKHMKTDRVVIYSLHGKNRCTQTQSPDAI